MINRPIIDLVKALEWAPDCIGESMKSLDGLSPNLSNNALTVEVLRELYLRPYLTARELSERYAISKGEVRRIYASLRSVEILRYLFEFSPYAYLIKTLRELAKDSPRTLRIIRGERPWPLSKTMELFISASCNARCEFCYRNGQIYNEQTMPTRAFLSLIDQFADLDGENLDLSGGLEPLLGPSVLQVLEKALERKLRVSLYTNGIELDKPDLLKYLVKLDRIRVSLNACDRDSYTRVTGVDEFEAVKRNLRKLTGERGRSNATIGIGFVVYEKNYTRIHDAIKLAQQLDLDFVDLRSVHVTPLGDFNEEQRAELRSILREVRQAMLFGRYGRLRVNIADTFNLIERGDDLLANLRSDFVNALVNFRITVTPQGRVYALNVIAQPTREDSRYLLGKFSEADSLFSILKGRRDIPFEPRFFLPHDISVIAALSKLKSDLEFGIGLNECPFSCENLGAPAGQT